MVMLNTFGWACQAKSLLVQNPFEKSTKISGKSQLWLLAGEESKWTHSKVIFVFSRTHLFSNQMDFANAFCLKVAVGRLNGKPRRWSKLESCMGMRKVFMGKRLNENFAVMNLWMNFYVRFNRNSRLLYQDGSGFGMVCSRAGGIMC